MPVNRNGVASSDLARAKRVAFERTLGLPEAVGPSLSIAGPSMAMAFNVSLVVRAAGRAAPLAFAIGVSSFHSCFLQRQLLQIENQNERWNLSSHKPRAKVREMLQAEIEESNRYSREFWKLFAQASSGGEVFDRDGLTIANAKQPWFFMNVAMLNGPISDQFDLEERAQEALGHFERYKNPWVLTAREGWFGQDSEWILSRFCLERKLDLTGMLAERLSAPTRPLPHAQLRRIDDEETRFALADLNADTYGVLRHWARQALGSAALWRGSLFGRIACVEGEPVSGAFALPIGKALYVGWVATSKTNRRLGFAELVIRASLEDAGKATSLQRTILHATNDGLPVYTRMGYRSVVKFPLYGPRSAETSLQQTKLKPKMKNW